MTVVGNDELQKRFGLSSGDIAELESAADAYDAGVWPRGRVSRIGRPPLCDEKTTTVSHVEPLSKVAAIDAKARERGLSRSDALRAATDLWLSVG